MSLKPRQESFVREYLKDLNATRAYKDAGFRAKNDNVAAVEAHKLLRNPKIAEAVQGAMRARAERLKLTADGALRRFRDIAWADPNELIEFRRSCCRHCHGKAHRFQHTLAEMARRTKAWQTAVEKAQRTGKPKPPPFDDEGGVGFNPHRPPHPDCPECFGAGVGQAFVKDTRALSPEARALYAGLKVTREGVEVKMHDQLSALVSVGKHLGMFSGDGESGAASNHLHLHLAAAELRKLPPDELRRLYREALGAPEEAEDETPADP